MAFCANLRELDVFMYVTNRFEFGHLIDADTFDTSVADPDMYQIFENPKDWEARYIHPDYAENFNPDKKPLQVNYIIYPMPHN